MSERPAAAAGEEGTRRLLVLVSVLSLAVIGLGAAVLVLKLSRTEPTTKSEAIVRDWQEFASALPDDDRAQLGHALTLLEAGRGSEARSALERVLELNPENWTALGELGLLLRESDPERAEELLTKAGELAPRRNRGAWFIAIGQIRLEREDLEGARAAFEDAVADLPFLIDAHTGLAQVLEQLGDTEAALAQYERALRFAPGDEELREAVTRLGGDPEAVEEGSGP